MPLRDDQGTAWNEFRRIRARYEPLIAVLGRITDAPRRLELVDGRHSAPQSTAVPPRPRLHPGVEVLLSGRKTLREAGQPLWLTTQRAAGVRRRLTVCSKS